MSTQRCIMCGKMLHEGDSIAFTGQAIYHNVPSAVTYAISDVSACYDMRHAYCEPEGDPDGL